MPDGVSGKHVIPGLNPQGEEGQFLRPGVAQCYGSMGTEAAVASRPRPPLASYLGLLIHVPMQASPNFIPRPPKSGPPLGTCIRLGPGSLGKRLGETWASG